MKVHTNVEKLQPKGGLCLTMHHFTTKAEEEV
jgi:hypothetical protein